MRNEILLTLHKQHYMDKSNKLNIKNISCLGYYDEISIDEIDEKTKYRLTEDSPCNPLSDIWYNIGKKISSLNGRYSNLCVALFRCIQEQDSNNYWEEEKTLPYFGCGFIKLGESLDYQKVIRIIENQLKIAEEPEEHCKIISYCTLDSADIVVLVKANRISLLEKAFFKIENEVKYLHSIIGIDEEFLKEYDKNRQVSEKEGTPFEFTEWNGKPCFLHDEIKEINIRLVSQGAVDISRAIFMEWQKIKNQIVYQNEECYYTLGHANVAIDILGTDVNSLIRMLVPKGFLTHTNPLYENNVYNIESCISVCKKQLNMLDWAQGSKKENKDDENVEEYYCDRSIKEYEALMTHSPDGSDGKLCSYRSDEGFYSYSQALLLTLNALAQYEKFDMSKDLFWLIYPSLRMFNTQMIAKWELLKDTTTDVYVENIVLIKKALCDYLESVNSVIYHTIHTDQVYLMIPGYSGTSYSIPIKLSMFYMCFIKKLINILNDGNENCGCILTPGMEAKPSTGEIEIDLNIRNKIIMVNLSQRQLYFPRNLMIILSHELGHYVGKGIRCREERKECLFNILTYYICEGLIPEENPTFSQSTWRLFTKEKKGELEVSLADWLREDFDSFCDSAEYYSYEIKTPLVKRVINILSENTTGNKIKQIIYKIDGEVAEYINKDSGQYAERMNEVAEIQCHIDQNRLELISSSVFAYIIDEIITIFQEIFSDIATLEILQCSYKFAQESFNVSEGVAYDDKKEASHNVVRKRIMRKILDVKTKETYDCTPYEMDLTKYLVENMFSFTWMNKCLEDYAKICKKKIGERLTSVSEIQDDIKYVREVYNQFINSNVSVFELYNTIIDSNNLYRDIIKKQYQDDLTDSGG